MALVLTSAQTDRLKRAFLFQGVDEFTAEWIVRAPQCTLERYARGNVVFDETHFTRSLGILLSGRLRVDKSALGGKTMTISQLYPGDAFGAAAMFVDQEEYVSIVTAEQESEVLFIPEGVIRWAMRRDFNITENYVRYLSNRIRFLQGTISALTAGSAEQRMAAYLLERSEEGAITTAMTGLSQRLNIGRASLYRAVDALEAQRLISRDGKTIHILDRDGLINRLKNDR